MSRANFESYLAGTSGTAFEDDELTVSVGNPLVRETLEQRFRPHIVRALFDVVGRPCRVRLVSGGGRATVTADGYGMFALAEAADEPTPRQSGLPRRAARTTTVEPPALGGWEGSPLNPRYTFERFIVGTSNRLAHAASQAVADAPGQAYNPLFLYGGVGLGKTHLLHAIGHEVVPRGLSVVYVSSEKFTNEMIESIRERRADDFRNRYRRANILMIDDIQFIAGKVGTQEEFFHTFNAIHESGGQIVLTSDKPPKAIPTLEDRLRSRFEMGLIADIQSPDIETRIAILRSKTNGRITIPGEVLELIAQKIQSNIRELEGSLNRVTAYAMLHGKEVTTELALEALADLVDPVRVSREPDAIVDAVARHFGVTVEDLRGKARHQKIVAPRHLAMYLLREDARLSYPQIGALLGRDHTSALHGYEKIGAEIDRNGSILSHVRAIRDGLR
ncbi:MAG: chromosomal replication initiator protein DnaA [Chloroflexi bacterium]|nr:chromosomal replication initiator protein DnaA [Chloroflexota bacterium]